MKRRLVWTCSGLATAGLLALLYVALAAQGEDQNQAGAGRPAPSTPAAASSGGAGSAARIETLKRRLAKDDGLRPPPANASPDEWMAYEEFLALIEQGNDPLKAVVPPVANLDQRMDDRRKKGTERREENKKRAEKAKARVDTGHSQYQLESEANRLEAGLPPRDPGKRPPPVDLGPPIVPGSVEPPKQK